MKIVFLGIGIKQLKTENLKKKWEAHKMNLISFLPFSSGYFLKLHMERGRVQGNDIAELRRSESSLL